MTAIYELEQAIHEVDSELVSTLADLKQLYLKGQTKDITNPAIRLNKLFLRRTTLLASLAKFSQILSDRHKNLPDAVLVEMAMKYKAQIAIEKSDTKREKLRQELDAVLAEVGVVKTNVPIKVQTNKKGFKRGTGVKHDGCIWKITDIVDSPKGCLVLLSMMYDKNMSPRSTKVEWHHEDTCAEVDPQYKELINKYNATLKQMRVAHQKAYVELETSLLNSLKL